MPVTFQPPAPSAQPAPRLRQRLLELRSVLESAAHAVPQETHGGEVVDFKDLAAEDLRAHVDEVACAHAVAEIGQVVAALKRIADGSYGQCEDCGEPIDERRLQALPATAFCTACQALHEREHSAQRRRTRLLTP